MDTRYWGPSGWKLLHSITFSYKEHLKNKYYDFFYIIAFLLPCKHCRKSYSEYITNDPIDTTSKEAFTKWLWRIHNKVNEKLEKPKITIDDFYVKYYEEYKPKDIQIKEYHRWREKIIYIMVVFGATGLIMYLHNK